MFNIFKKKKAEPKNLKEVLEKFKELENNFDKLSKELKGMKKESRFFVQKIGVVRFNPFSEVGGDQSFSLAVLDGQDSGFVITSLYTREGNRVYAKPIKESGSEYLLSDEEKEAIKKAQNGNKNPKHSSKTTGRGGNGAH